MTKRTFRDLSIERRDRLIELGIYKEVLDYNLLCMVEKVIQDLTNEELLDDLMKFIHDKKEIISKKEFNIK